MHRVEILWVASGRNVCSNWFKHKGNLLAHVSEVSGGLQIQGQLDAGLTKLSQGQVLCTSPDYVILVLRWALPLSPGSSRPHILLASYPAGKRREFLFPGSNTKESPAGCGQDAVLRHLV